jgi:hypothetical protein
MVSVGVTKLILVVAGAAVALGVTAARSPADSTTPSSCSAISPRRLTDYSQTIAAAHRAADADAARNGSSGQYAVAARNARDQLKQALDRATAAAADLRTDPAVTTPAEAGTIKEHIRFILQLVPQAAHWAIISEIYHDSNQARQAFEGSVKVLSEGNLLFAEAGRCYMEL